MDLPAPLRYQSAAFYNRRTPHNAYVKLLAEGGVVGITPFALLWAWVAYGGLRKALSARSSTSIRRAPGIRGPAGGAGRPGNADCRRA